MRAATTIVSSSLVALLCLAVAGCAPSGPGSPTPTATPTASVPSEAPPAAQPEVPVAGEQPESRYGLECDTLVDPALVTAVFSTTLAPVDPLVADSADGIWLPFETSILSLGGTVCEWSSAEVTNPYGFQSRYTLAVSVTPRPDTGWSSNAADQGMPSTEHLCEKWYCFASDITGDAWVALEARAGLADPVAVDALFTRVVAVVRAAGPAKPLVMPLRDRPALPSECEAVLPLETVRSISGVAVLAPQRNRENEGWSPGAEARIHAEDEGCRWMTLSEDRSVVAVGWVRGGRWAYQRALAAGTFTPVTVNGLGTGDLANLRCLSPIGEFCAVDLAEAVVAQLTR